MRHGPLVPQASKRHTSRAVQKANAADLHREGLDLAFVLRCDDDPAERVTEPPGLERALVDPAVTATAPPAPEPDSPTATEMDPAALPDDDPVDTVKSPDSAPDDPVDTDTCPDAPCDCMEPTDTDPELTEPLPLRSFLARKYSSLLKRGKHAQA